MTDCADALNIVQHLWQNGRRLWRGCSISLEITCISDVLPWPPSLPNTREFSFLMACEVYKASNSGLCDNISLLKPPNVNCKAAYQIQISSTLGFEHFTFVCMTSKSQYLHESIRQPYLNHVRKTAYRTESHCVLHANVNHIKQLPNINGLHSEQASEAKFQ